MGPSIAELCICYIGIIMTAYYIFLSTVKQTYSLKRKAAGGAVCILLGILMGCVYNYIPIICVLFFVALYYLIIDKVFGLGKKKNTTMTLVSLGLSYVFFYLTFAVFVFLLYLNKTAVAFRFERSVDAWIYILHYITCFKGGMIARSVMFAIQFSMAVIFLRIKEVKNELTKLPDADRNEVLIFLWLLALSLRLLYMVSILRRNDATAVVIVCLILFMLTFFIAFSWTKKELKTAYVTKLQDNELDLIEKSLDGNEAYLRRLRADNKRLSGIIHKDNKLIPAAVMSVRKAAAAGGDAWDTLSAGDAISIREIYAERSDALAVYEAHMKKPPQTGETAVNAVLLYYAERAASMGVAFHVSITADIKEMLDTSLKRSELSAVVADLCEYAMEAVREREEGLVALRIGEDSGHYFVETSDNGENCNLRRLKELGKKEQLFVVSPSDENKGLFPLFKILRHTGAKLKIDESPACEEFTKTIRVAFVKKSD